MLQLCRHQEVMLGAQTDFWGNAKILLGWVNTLPSLCLPNRRFAIGSTPEDFSLVLCWKLRVALRTDEDKSRLPRPCMLNTLTELEMLALNPGITPSRALHGSLGCVWATPAGSGCPVRYCPESRGGTLKSNMLATLLGCKHHTREHKMNLLFDKVRQTWYI